MRPNQTITSTIRATIGELIVEADVTASEEEGRVEYEIDEDSHTLYIDDEGRDVELPPDISEILLERFDDRIRVALLEEADGMEIE